MLKQSAALWLLRPATLARVQAFHAIALLQPPLPMPHWLRLLHLLPLPALPFHQMYTDVKAELDDVQGGFCPGLEAPFGQLNIAFKRLVTPNNLNPDGSVPPSVHPGLPWWDMTGYMWRGVASVRLRGLTVVLANTESPHVGLRDEKLALTAATLNLGVAAGRIDLTATKLSAFAHMAAPDARSGGQQWQLILASGCRVGSVCNLHSAALASEQLRCRTAQHQVCAVQHG